jgi:hypothetical protein
VVLKLDIVNPRADQINRTFNARSIDAHPLWRSERGCKINRAGWRSLLSNIARSGNGGCTSWCRCNLFDWITARKRSLGIEIPHAHVPSQDEQAGKRYGEQQITLIVQGEILKLSMLYYVGTTDAI